MTLVLKFGGSSLGSADRIGAALDRLEERLDQSPLVVCSALGSTTDALERIFEGDQGALAEIIRFHREVVEVLEIDFEPLTPLFAALEQRSAEWDQVRESCTASERDLAYSEIVSFGERIATRIVSAAWRGRGHAGKALDAWEVGFISSGLVREATLGEEATQRVRESLNPLCLNYDFTPFITGFLARNEHEQITTLGRGGSDLTAVFLGAALGAEEVQLWKDVSGLLTADPRIVNTSRSLAEVSFEEASELAYCGAKVLHPLSIQPALRTGTNVRIMNSLLPDFEGTLIGAADAARSSRLVTSISCKRGITVVDLVASEMLGQHGFLADVFRIFHKHHISVDMVATSEVSVSMTLNRGFDLGAAEEELKSIARMSVQRSKALISLVGDVSRASEILSGAFRVLESEGIQVQMVSQGALKRNVGLLINDEQAEQAVRALHEFFIDRPQLQVEAA